MNKVLIIGPDFFNYNESVARAFNSIGFTSKVVSHGDLFTPFSLKNKILYTLHINKIKFLKKNQDKLNFNIIEIYDKFKPELVLIIKGNKLYPKTLQHMDKSTKILWMMDSLYQYPDSYSNIHYFDHLFMFERTDVDRLKKVGISSHFLPLALDEKIYYPLENCNKDIDISFIGTLYPKRMEILQKLIKEFPDKKIKVYGKYIFPVKNIVKYLTRKQKEIFTNKHVTPSEANNIYNRSKICINIHHGQSQYGVNPRFFEILGARTLQLVDRNPFIKEYFPNEIIVEYDGFDELVQLCRQYLNEYSTDIVEKGYQEVLENHTFNRRIKQIIKIINGE